MSIQLMSATWQRGPDDRSQRLLMLALADCANDGGLCWPSTQTLAAKACMNVRTVLRTLKDLELKGWLSITRRSHERRGNTYQILLERLNPPLSGVTMSRDTVSCDKLSRDKTTPSEVTNRTNSHDKTNNPPHPPIGRTIKNHQEPSADFALTGEPSVPGKAKDGITALVEPGWSYYLEKTKKSPRQYTFSLKRKELGRKGFDSLVEFAKGNEHPDPQKAAAELFALAVDRLANSPHHNGKNDSGTKYLDWETLFEGPRFVAPTKLLEFWLDDSRWPA